MSRPMTIEQALKTLDEIPDWTSGDLRVLLAMATLANQWMIEHGVMGNECSCREGQTLLGAWREQQADGAAQ